MRRHQRKDVAFAGVQVELVVDTGALAQVGRFAGEQVAFATEILVGLECHGGLLSKVVEQRRALSAPC